MEEKGIEKASLVGHSFGGAVGTLFASRYPEMVDRLVLVDTAGIWKPAMQDSFAINSLRAKKLNRIMYALFVAVGASSVIIWFLDKRFDTIAKLISGS